MMPKKEREGKTVLRMRKERARLAGQEEETGRERRRRRWLARQARKEEVEEKQPPSPVHHPSPAKSSSPTREVAQVMEGVLGWVEEANRLVEAGQSPSSLPT